ncbi:hypothetical protein JOC54_002869 [Alkalihalobacillus xiaoxiensis]|uniref:Uncharacterized protein n=1 Tax=Shouchella xiaoxiensis TaxID=766895 RepID=A0ABS2SYS9_9BACI|nr:hypothetical protein [Shouchella xiaoxiensis]
MEEKVNSEYDQLITILAEMIYTYTTTQNSEGKE